MGAKAMNNESERNAASEQEAADFHPHAYLLGNEQPLGHGPVPAATA
jgi:hypothetical protein